jgi:hypothetical protein
VCLFTAVIAGCSPDAGDDGARPPGTPRAHATTTTLTFGSNVYLVPAAAGAQVTASSVVLTGSPALTAGGPSGTGKPAGALAVGDFLINDYGAPSFARCVTAIATSGGTITATTRKAGLDELVEDGAFTEVVPNVASGGATASASATRTSGLAPDGLAPDALAPDVIVPLPPFDISLANLPSFTAGNITLTVKSDSHLSFDPDLDIGIQFGFFTVNEFHAILDGAVNGKLDLDVKVSAGQATIPVSKQVFASQPLPIPIPGTPLELTGKLYVYLDCSLSAAASMDVTTGFNLTGNLTAGGHFRNGAWGGDGALPSFTPITPAITDAANLHASCDVRPRLEMLLEDVVGPFIDIVPSVYADLTFTAPPPKLAWNVGWTLSGQLGGTLDVIFKQFTIGPVQIFNTGAQLGAGTIPMPTGFCNVRGDCPTGDYCQTNHQCVASSPPPSPPPSTDNCASAQDGVYCGYSKLDGFSGKGDSDTLYSCKAHKTTSDQLCPLSEVCKINSSGADYCECEGTVCGTRCCSEGAWCGESNKCCTGCAPGCPC